MRGMVNAQLLIDQLVKDQKFYSKDVLDRQELSLTNPKTLSCSQVGIRG